MKTATFKRQVKDTYKLIQELSYALAVFHDLLQSISETDTVSERFNQHIGYLDSAVFSTQLKILRMLEQVRGFNKTIELIKLRK